MQNCRYNRKSLKVLGTVGEPINPEAWLWYYHTVGDERCVIVDTYWQTETVSSHLHRNLIGCLLLVGYMNKIDHSVISCIQVILSASCYMSSRAYSIGLH